MIVLEIGEQEHMSFVNYNKIKLKTAKTNAKYDWNSWFNGQQWTLEIGTDYNNIANIKQAAKVYAKKNGYDVFFGTDSSNRLLFEAKRLVVKKKNTVTTTRKPLMAPSHSVTFSSEFGDVMTFSKRYCTEGAPIDHKLLEIQLRSFLWKAYNGDQKKITNVVWFKDKARLLDFIDKFPKNLNIVNFHASLHISLNRISSNVA